MPFPIYLLSLSERILVIYTSIIEALFLELTYPPVAHVLMSCSYWQKYLEVRYLGKPLKVIHITYCVALCFLVCPVVKLLKLQHILRCIMVDRKKHEPK